MDGETHRVADAEREDLGLVFGLASEWGTMVQASRRRSPGSNFPKWLPGLCASVVVVMLPAVVRAGIGTPMPR